LYEREGVEPVGIAVISLIILVVIALIAIPILMRVFGEAAERNPNRPDDEGSDEPEGDQSRRSE
jgi:flagellar basal body-associated protein FliL